MNDRNQDAESNEEFESVKNFPVYRWIGLLLVLVVLIINIIRSNNISITIDEATTYNLFVSQGWKRILTSFHSNNHILNSLLIRISTTVFGLSHISMRLPALLGGGLYLLTSERICYVFFKHKLSYWLSLGLLTLSPFMMDYLIVARGYSLALGFFMAAFLLSSLDLIVPSFSEGQKWKKYNPILVSVLIGLSTAGNISFAFVNMILIFVYYCGLIIRLLIYQEQNNIFSTYLTPLIYLAAPGLSIFLSLNPAIVYFRKAEMYFGSESWIITYDSLVEAVFRDYSVYKERLINPESIFNNRSVLIFGAIGLTAGIINLIVPFIGNAGKDRHFGRNRKLLIFVFSVLALTLALYSVANNSLDLLLPIERTGIYFVPLIFLSLGLAIDTLGKSWFQRVTKLFLHSGIIFTILYFVTLINFEYIRQWRFDSSSREIFLELLTLEDQVNEFSVGINWMFEPSFNFYRTYYGETDFPEFTRDGPQKNQKVFVLLPAQNEADRQFILDHDIQIYFRDPTSFAVIGIKE